MATRIHKISVTNFRALAATTVELGPVSVLFGPNGSGKSTFLDSIWFIRDCAIRGVELASSSRSHGIGILYDGASENDETITLRIETEDVAYQMQLDLASGRINPSAGETLITFSDPSHLLIERKVGTNTASLFNEAVQQDVQVLLREPDKLSLNLYLNFNPADHKAGALDRLLHFVRFYHTRSFFLHHLRIRGSETSHEVNLWDRGQNAWSVLRNVHDKRDVDDRFNTIVGFMKEAFPAFDGLVLDQTGPNSVYASFREKERRHEIQASGVSDGHLHLLLLLTALFSEGDRSSLILFDEPEISLHPWALAVLAKAIKVASEHWNKQVIVATHSPVLISQFDSDSILAAEVAEGQTHLRRLSDMPEIQELLNEYAAGSLYMAQEIAAQAVPHELPE